jgi:hypothetical protein
VTAPARPLLSPDLADALLHSCASLVDGTAGCETALADLAQGHLDLDPETVEQGLVKLVMSVIETLRQLIERQAIRRAESGALTDEQIERLGLTLLRLEQRMDQLRRIFGLEGEDLELRLGPFTEINDL